MSDAIWVAALLFLIWPGLITWRLPVVARLDLPARLAMAFAAGMVIVVVLLYGYNFAHVPWTRVTVGFPLIVIGCFGLRRRAEARLHTDMSIPIVVFAAITVYGVATARETCGDLIYFWGPKAERFHYAGKIDADFLAFPHYFLMHPDYPPLLPLAYAWPSLVAHRFSWWGPLFLTPIALLAMAFAFRGFTRSGWHAVLLTAIAAYGFAIGMVAGAADPPLLLFEIIAIAALTFAGDQRDGRIIASIALAAAAFTKVEGAAFAIVALIAFLIVTRKIARTALLAVPSIVLLGSWILFSAQHHLLDAYWKAKSATHFEALGTIVMGTLRQASYDVAFVPWIAPLALLAITRRLRRAALPLLVAAGSIASTIFFYLHADDPGQVGWWIDASAMRVLLTPLACLVVASAAGVVESPGDGVVPQGKETEGGDRASGQHS
jgi:hypothetical protein